MVEGDVHGVDAMMPGTGNQQANWNATQRLATMGVSLGVYPSRVQTGNTR